MNKRVRFLTLPVVAATSLVIALLPTSAQAAPGDPSVSITSPVDGSVVWGRVQVSVSGTTDQLGTDTPAQLQLFIDGGATPAQTFDCPVTATPNNCDNTFTWDATTLTGAHVLTAAIVTTSAVTVTSTPVNVTVSNPAPTVSITSPATGDTVFGGVSVSVTGGVDALLTDGPAQLLLSVDSAAPLTFICPAPGPANTCSHTFTWDATGLTGAHTLAATIVTNNAVQVVSAPISVTVNNPAPTVSITSPADNSTVIGLTTVSVSAGTNTTLSDFPSSVELFVDGVSFQSQNCPAPLTAHSCTTSFTWDATQLSGPHVLTAAVHTTNTVTNTSAAVNVTVSNPAPTVQILSPSSGDTVSGVRTVSIEGVTNVALTDYPSQVTLYVDGVSSQTLSCPLPQTDHTCTVPFNWDSTGLSGTHTLSATLQTVNGLAATSGNVDVTVNSAAPRVAVTSPADGSTVTGTVDVSVSGVTSFSQTDYPEQLQFYVDGVQVRNYPCPTPSSFHTCSFNFQWDTTGMSGDHIITAREVTTRGLTATSTPVTVTASNPLPTVSVTSPADGSTVSGITTVRVTGSTDGSQTDYPQSLALYIDGTLFQTAPCPIPLTAHSCQSAFTWDATGLAGTHILTATVTTTRNLTVTSSADSITVNSPAPTATITSPADGTTVSDVVKVAFAGTTDASQTDYPSQLTLFVDGTQFTSFPCPLPHSVHACAGSVNWDTAGLSGTHVLSASVSTTKGRTGTSTAVSVTVNNPDPTASVLSPSDGSTVVGVTSVDVSGTTDSSQNDYPTQLVLYVDGNSFRSYNCPLPQTVHACDFVFTWDATGMSGNHALSATVLTSRNKTGTSQPVTVTVNTPPPTAIVTSPTTGSTVSGTFSIAVTGSTDPALSDYPSQLALHIDGKVFQTYNCPVPLNVHTCGNSFTWDSTGLSGAHSFALSITTTRNVTLIGTAVTVTVNSPAPAVTIKSPGGGSRVSGAVPISVVGSTNLTQSDKPTLVQLYIDGRLFQDYYCPTAPTSKTCVVTYRWDSSGKLGPHSLRAQMRTAKGLLVVSKAVPITVTRVQAVVSVVGPATAIAGKTVVLKGCVRASSNGRAAAKIQIVVTVTPAFGKPTVLKAVSSSKGCYSVSYKAVANSTITAKSVASSKFASSSTSMTQLVGVAVTCKVSSPKVQLGVKVVTTCTLPGLKPGLIVEMQFKQGGAWHNVLVVSAGGTKRTFTIALGSAGTYVVRVVLPKNRYFMLSESKPFTFTVA